MEIKLYGHPDSGHAYKVALALRIGRVEYDYEFVDIWAPRETRAPSFLVASKWGEVPCLIWDGEPIIQSGAILLRLARELDLFGGANRLDTLGEWINWEANRIGMCLPQLIHAKRAPDQVPPPVQSWLRGRYDADIARLNEALMTSNFLLGDQISVADLAVYGYLSKCELAGLTPPKPVDDWRLRIGELPYFKTADKLLGKQ